MSELEPVAYLHTCRKKPGSKALKWQKDDPVLASRGYKPEPLVTVEQAEAHTAAKVREALEEAAKVCESRVGTGDPGIDTTDADIEAKECAEAIRALIPSQTGDTE